MHITVRKKQGIGRTPLLTHKALKPVQFHLIVWYKKPNIYILMCFSIYFNFIWTVEADPSPTHLFPQMPAKPELDQVEIRGLEFNAGFNRAGKVPRP